MAPHSETSARASARTTPVQVRVYGGDGSLPCTIRIGLEGDNAIFQAFGQKASVPRAQLEEALQEIREEQEALSWWKRLSTHPARCLSGPEGELWVSAYREGMVRLNLPIVVRMELTYNPLPGLKQESSQEVRMWIGLGERQLTRALAWADEQA